MEPNQNSTQPPQPIDENPVIYQNPNQGSRNTSQLKSFIKNYALLIVALVVLLMASISSGIYLLVTRADTKTQNQTSSPASANSNSLSQNSSVSSISIGKASPTPAPTVTPTPTNIPTPTITPAPTGPAKIPGWITFSNSDFSIQYPPDWMDYSSYQVKLDNDLRPSGFPTPTRPKYTIAIYDPKTAGGTQLGKDYNYEKIPYPKDYLYIDNASQDKWTVSQDANGNMGLNPGGNERVQIGKINGLDL